MSDIRFFVISKDQDFKIKKEDLEKTGVFVTYVKNNKQNITQLYNEELLSVRSGNSLPDYLILMHADVSFDVKSILNHLELVKNKYDIIGLCGCEKFVVSESPLNWFCGSRKFPEYRWGCVTHGELGGQTSFFSKHRSEMDHEVACIDGLCIILTKKAIESGIKFDPELKFNCYDTQISLDAILNYKLKLGVIVEPSLQHYSVGRSILTDDFLKEELILRRKFNFGIPKGSRLEKLIEEKMV